MINEFVIIPGYFLNALKRRSFRILKLLFRPSFNSLFSFIFSFPMLKATRTPMRIPFVQEGNEDENLGT